MKYLYYLFFFIIQLNINAQLISVKSLPISSGDQLLIFPASNLSMSGLSIGMEDKWFDVFSNPANGSNIDNLSIFLLPTFYNTSGNLGGASTIPITVFLKNNEWFGVVSIALQNHEGAKINNNFWMGELLNRSIDRNNSNTYGRVSIGKKISSSNWMIGASIFSASLKAVDGVDLLYDQSTNIDQDGNIFEVRGGITYKDSISTFESVVIYNTYNMQHSVEYFYSPLLSSLHRPTEINKDRTNTWGIHFDYREKSKKKNIEIGAIATMNYKSHPKIPNYSIMNIPRDPGNSWAFNFGVGLGSHKETSKFGIEIIYEPIWSNTWAEATEVIESNFGKNIYPGQKTVENDFTFNNIKGKIGFSKRFEIIELSAGLEIYNRSYSLIQQDNILEHTRSQEEQWTEYIWSWGSELNFRYFNIKYAGHILTGAGIPSVFRRTFFDSMEGLRSANDFVVAPSGSLSIDYKTTLMHQFILHIPLPY